MHDPQSPDSTIWPPPPAGAMLQDSQPPQFTRRSAFLVFLLTLLTAGVYSAVWLDRVAARLRSLRPQGAVHPAFGVVAVVLTAFGLVGDVVDGLLNNSALDGSSRLLNRVIGLFLLVFCFQIRTQLVLLIGARRGGPDWVSGLWTFLFGAAYLQHRINRTLTATAPAPTAAGGPMSDGVV